MTHTKINHAFTYPQLSYEAGPNVQQCVKLAFYFNKLPDVSHEHFYAHWSTVHADLTVAAKDFAAVKIQRYVQVAQNPDFKAKAAELAGVKMLDFDGCSEIWVRSWEDWMKFYNSKEYAAALGPDCRHFMQTPISVYVGQENVIFGEGTPVEGSRDGILERDVIGYEDGRSRGITPESF